MEVPVLYDLIYEFLTHFFIGEHLVDDTVVQLITIVLSVLFVYGLIVRPIMWLCGFRRKK